VAPALARALAWVLNRQAAPGCWHGLDGRPTVADTAAGLEALVTAGAHPPSRGLRRAGRWLRFRQNRNGLWTGEGRVSNQALTARVVRAMIAARSAEVDAIERGVNALLMPAVWNNMASASVREVCDIAEGLAAFLEWNRDLPEVPSPDAPSIPVVAIRALSLHA